jgi:putative hemolysin
MALEIAAIFLLVMANGVFALSEIAVVSARKARLQQRAEAGSRGARTALKLASDSDDFLSTVQVGITLIGTLAGAFGGATIATRIAPQLNQVSWIAPHGETFAMAVVVISVSYLSLILGELVPKRLALSDPERFASALAPVMRGLSRAASPAVRFLTWSTDIVSKLLPFKASTEPAVTQEEIRLMVRQGAEAGTFEESEQQMVEGVFRLAGRRAVELMRPRHEVAWLNLQKSRAEMLDMIRANHYSRYPVGDGSLDDLKGFVHVKDVLDAALDGAAADVGSVVRMIPTVPEHTPALRVLETFRQSGTHIAAVITEHGGVEGILTLNDIMEAVVGELEGAGEPGSEWATQRADGSWLVKGLMPVYEFKELAGIRSLPRENDGTYTTLGGFVMTTLGRIPKRGDRCEVDGRTYEVAEMDRNRVAKVAVSAPAAVAQAE